jgi:FKBP-type peptidyl-prolyl cis-trans isomerase FkpA
MRHLFFSGIFSLLTIAAAGQKTPPASSVATANGYHVINHTNKKGQKAAANDIAKVHVSTWVGDTLMQDTRAMSDAPRSLTVPDVAAMPAGRKVPALFDAFVSSGEGDSVTIYQAIDETIKNQLPAALKNETWVRYEVVLVEVVTQAEQAKIKADAEAQFVVIEAKVKSTIAQYAAGQLTSRLVTLPSGLKMLVEEKGSGGPLKVGEQVAAHYYGALTNAKMFDNSFQRGEPLPFALGVGQMIPGFDEGTQQLNHGGKAFLFIPANLGYGANGTPDGSIPPNSELVFYIEVQ